MYKLTLLKNFFNYAFKIKGFIYYILHFIIKIFLTQDVLECTHFFKVKFDNKKSYKIRAGKRFKNLKVFKFREKVIAIFCVHPKNDIYILIFLCYNLERIKGVILK